MYRRSLATTSLMMSGEPKACSSLLTFDLTAKRPMLPNSPMSPGMDAPLVLDLI